MSPAQAVLASWSFPPWVTALDLLTALLYLRGWLLLRRLLPQHLPTWRLGCFLSGIVALQLALASPIDAFDAFSLADHMVQHLVLMVVVPPLLLLGNPMIPILRGWPRGFTRRVLGPILRWPPLVRLARALTHPALCLTVFALALFVWHAPGPYDLALRSDGWHDFEHASFLFSSILFWWPVVQPWPGRPRWPRWTMPVYLMAATVVGGIVSAFLIFSGRVIYPAYLAMPRLGGISALDDQVLAGVIMWAAGSLAFAIPALYFVVTLLTPARSAPAAPPAATRRLRRHPKFEKLPAAAVLVLPLAVLIAAYSLPHSIDIDGDVVRAQAQDGPYRVSVFTPPDPLPPGPLAVAVLVQNRAGDAVLNVPVAFNLTTDAGAASASVAGADATTADSSLKLLQAGSLRLPGPGAWRLEVALPGVGDDPIQSVLHAVAQ